MPHIMVKGVTEEEAMILSASLVDEIVDLTGISKNGFVFEYTPSIFMIDGKKVVDNMPIITIQWFKRDESTMAKAVQIVENKVRSFGYKDVVVYFDELIKSNYYKNQAHYGEKSVVCPLCKEINQCAFSLGEDPKTCWCMTTKVPEALKEQVPENLRGKACICPDCVKKYNESLERGL